jgi:hypothetical protein
LAPITDAGSGLSTFGRSRTIRKLPSGRENSSRDFLHRFEIYLLDRIRDLVIIRVAAVHVEDDRHAFLRVVEMIGAIEELLGIVRIVVLEVEIQIEKFLLTPSLNLAKLRAHHP